MARMIDAVALGALLCALGGCSADDGGDSANTSGTPLGEVTCRTEPPPGAEMPAELKAYSGGQCPALQAGTNTITSMQNQRQFILALPSDYTPGERLPVAVLWHWLGGSAQDFLNIAFLQTVADKLRFIAVIPEKKGDVQFSWPFIDPEPRVNEELTFFDDMLACVAQQYDVNRNCVSTVGVSAGGLWVGVLGWKRSEYLSSMLSLSGGSPPGANAWAGAVHKLPALVQWGGPNDTFVLNFQDTSVALEQALDADGHFMVECVHNCGHGVPPLEGSSSIESMVEALVQFAVDHPYWLADGESPWQVRGMPVDMPSFCAIGMGQAVARTGDCTGSFP